MTLVIHWPQAVMLALYAIILICTAVLHGRPKTDKYNFWTSLLGTFLGFWLLYAGGFWS